MKEQKNPIFLIKKYYSILRATIAVELVVFVITLTDSLIAGNMIGPETLIAVGMVAPLIPIVQFITVMISSGTLLLYNKYIGKYDKDKADEVFCQGLFLAILTGILIALGMLVGKEAYIGTLSLSIPVEQYTRDYYGLILYYLALTPLSCLLDNTMMSEGREKLSAAANIAEIISNIILSLLLVRPLGIRGIALASVLAKLLFFVIIGRWSYANIGSKVRIFRLKLKICRDVLLNGIVRASLCMFLALTELILAHYVTSIFEIDTLTLLSVAFRLPALTSVFLGASMAVQPLVGTLRGERNTWGLRSVMKEVAKSMFLIGIALSLLIILFAPILVRSFGIKDRTLLQQGTVMLRCMGPSLVFQAYNILFFVYYYLIQKNGLSLLIIALNEFVMPVTLALLGGKITGAPAGLWAGLAVAPAVSLFISMLAVLFMYGKDLFPWLVSGNRDRQIRCYDFEIKEENAVLLSETLIGLLGRLGYSRESVLLAGMLGEDYFLLIKEINPPGKKIDAECCVIMEENGIRIVFRDSGVILDVTQSEGTGSLRDYIFSQVVTVPEYRFYLTTTGYNRIELQLAP